MQPRQRPPPPSSASCHQIAHAPYSRHTPAQRAPPALRGQRKPRRRRAHEKSFMKRRGIEDQGAARCSSSLASVTGSGFIEQGETRPEALASVARTNGVHVPPPSRTQRPLLVSRDLRLLPTTVVSRRTTP